MWSNEQRALLTVDSFAYLNRLSNMLILAGHSQIGGIFHESFTS